MDVIATEAAANQRLNIIYHPGNWEIVNRAKLSCHCAETCVETLVSVRGLVLKLFQCAETCFETHVIVGGHVLNSCQSADTCVETIVSVR